MSDLQADAAWSRLAEGDAAGALGLASAGEAEGPQGLVLRALCRYEAGDAAGAVADLDRALQAQPVHPVARLNRGLARFRAGDAKGAAADFRQGPFFPDWEFLQRFLRVFWPLRRTCPGLAVAGLEAPAAALPHEQEYGAWLARPESLAEAGRQALAKKLSAEATRLFFRNHRTSQLLLERALELVPDSPEYRNDLAFCQLHLAQAAEAERTLAPLIERGLQEYKEKRKREVLPHPFIVAHYAWALHDLGRHREALALLSSLRPQGYEDFGANLLAGLCWMELGERQKSRTAMHAALHAFYLDTWQMMLEPFWKKVLVWLETEEAEGMARG